MASHPQPRARRRPRRHTTPRPDCQWLVLVIRLALTIVVELIRARAGGPGCGH